MTIGTVIHTEIRQYLILKAKKTSLDIKLVLVVTPLHVNGTIVFRSA